MASGQDEKTLANPDGDSNLRCSRCKRQNRQTEAEHFCADCHDYYCLECVDVHNTFPAMLGHKLIQREEFKPVPDRDVPVVPTERCERHSFKVVDMYCQNHDDVGCYTCMAVDHRSCQDVLYIPEYIQQNKSAMSSEDVLKRLQTISNKLEDRLEIFKRESKRLIQRKVEEVEKIKAFRAEINQRLDELEKKSIANIEDEYKALIKKVDDSISTLMTSLTEVTSSHDIITSADSNTSQLFVSMKRGNQTTVKALKCLEAKEAQFYRTDIMCEPDERMQSLLAELTVLGEIIRKPALYRINKKIYNIKHQSDRRTCDIFSACMLPDDSFILADHGNKKVKRVDGSTYIIEDTCELPHSPWQLCVIEKNEVAVSHGGDEVIYFIATDGEMKVTREMKTDHDCYGIAYRNGNIYLADSGSTVFIYNMAGTRLRQFSTDQYGQPLFDDIYSLTVSNNEDEKIYVADNTHGLVMLSKHGKLLGKYKSPKLQRLREICVMEDESILVCGENSKNIIQFASNGTVVGEVLPADDARAGCQAVCVDRRHSKLIIGRCSDEMEIYDIV